MSKSIIVATSNLERVTEVPVAEAEELIRGSGLLYVINKFFLHPQGIALSFTSGDGPDRITIVRRESKEKEAWEFTPEADTAGKQKVKDWLQTKPPVHKDVRALLESITASVLGGAND